MGFGALRTEGILGHGELNEFWDAMNLKDFGARRTGGILGHGGHHIIRGAEN